MTIADRTTQSPARPSWLEKLRAASPPSAPTPPTPSPPVADKNAFLAAPSQLAHKPTAPMADLLIMSAVDQKAPPDLAGSADLLDALVQEHLERGAGPAPDVPDDMIAAPPPSFTEESPSSPLPVQLSSAERAAMLQREIDILLHDAPGEPAPAADPQASAPTELALQDPDMEAAPVAERIAEPPASEPPTAAAAPQESPPKPMAPADAPSPAPPTPAALPKDLSRAELDVLLAGDSPTPAPAAVPAPSVDTPLVNAAEAEQKLTEAEGVLAAELSKLIEESAGPAAPATAQPSPPADTAPPAATPPLNPDDAARAEEINKLMDAPVATPSAPATPPSIPAPLAATPAPAAAEVPTPAAAPAAALISANPPAPSRPGLLLRLQFALAAMVLMVAQLFDLPFNWLDDLSRNVVGVAAFLLLLGGILLWILSHMATLGG